MPEEYRELTKETENLLKVFTEKTILEEEKKAPKIQVDKIVSKLAFLYEKIRNIVDYKEEHLLRKNAIKRILRRRLGLKTNADSIAAPLIQELIRGGYLENNMVPENKIKKTVGIVNKYILLINYANSGKEREEKERKKLLDWILSLASCEIEDLFMPRYKDEAMASYMYQIMNRSIVWSSKKMTKEEKSIQIYIAVQRTLLKSDRDIITYYIFNSYYPSWRDNISDKLIKEVASDIDLIYQTTEDQIDHSLSGKLIRIIKKYIPPFLILYDVIESKSNKAHDILSESKTLENEVQEACQKRYSETRKKLRRSSIRSIIYIFLTKTLLALALEVPYDFFMASKVNYLPLGVNIIFHPLLLFFIALSIKVPAEKNTEKIFDIIRRVIYKGEEEIMVEKVRETVGRNIFINFLFNLIYFVAFIISFGLLIFLLLKLNFNSVGIIIFLLFLSLVSFFGIRNRESVRELIVVGEREGIITTIVDFFAIPVIRMGRWISLNFSRINVFVFIFDFIIEAPFKAFIEIIEDFSSFIREKKEEITMK